MEEIQILVAFLDILNEKTRINRQLNFDYNHFLLVKGDLLKPLYNTVEINCSNTENFGIEKE